MSDNKKRPNGADDHAGARDLLEQGQRVREDIAQFGDAARQAVSGWESVLRDRMRSQPYATLAVAAGVGYVLGGGMPPFVLRALLGFGGRVAIDNFIAQLATGNAGGGSRS